MFRSFQFKLAACFAVAVLTSQIALVLYLVLAVWWQPSPLWASFLQWEADRVVRRLNSGSSLDQAVQELFAARQAKNDRPGRERLIVDASGKVILNTLSLEVEELSKGEHELLDRIRNSASDTPELYNKKWIVAAVAAPIRQEGRTIGVIFTRTTPWGALLFYWPIRLTIAICIAILFSMVLSFLVSRPLRKVTDVATAIAQGDLSRRVPIRSRDEVGRLGQEFNRMTEKLQSTILELERERDKLEAALKQLQESESRRRQLVADASHELRTPIACMQGTLEALQDRLINDPVEQQEAITSIHEEALRLSRLVEDLLMLARAELGEVDIRREPVSVDGLVSRAVSKFKSRADSLGVELQVDSGQPDISIMGDQDRLTQVLDNLIENALQHTLRGERIRLSTIRQNGTASITVEDNGKGIPEDDLPHIFERFYRSDKSRTRSTGGAGLGLAITREIVEAHGGTITVDTDIDEGTRVCVQFPLFINQPA